MALNLAAGGFVDGTGLDKQHDINSQLVRFSNYLSDDLGQRFNIWRQFPLMPITTLHLGQVRTNGTLRFPGSVRIALGDAALEY